jgi:DNA-binding MarR family transcriptional regulator
VVRADAGDAEVLGVRACDIKEELSITVGGASKLVDRIEAAGLCRRRANPDDRRSQIIELTPAGRRLLAKATKSFEDELHTRLESVVTGRALDQFGATLMRLRASNRRVTSHEQIAPAW